jgi:uroporphyrinogen-III synthase
LLDALRTGRLAACVGPVTAAPLRQLGVEVLEPGRARLGALARALLDELPRRATPLRVAGTTVTLRGHAAVVDGTVKPLAQAPMAVLRALAQAHGRVLSRAELLAALPRGCDEHAVEMAITAAAGRAGRALVRADHREARLPPARWTPDFPRPPRLSSIDRCPVPGTPIYRR